MGPKGKFRQGLFGSHERPALLLVARIGDLGSLLSGGNEDPCLEPIYRDENLLSLDYDRRPTAHCGARVANIRDHLVEVLVDNVLQVVEDCDVDLGERVLWRDSARRGGDAARKHAHDYFLLVCPIGMRTTMHAVRL